MAQDQGQGIGWSDLQTLLTSLQQAVEGVNALQSTVKAALINIYDPNGSN